MGQKYCVNNNSQTSEPNKYVLEERYIEIINRSNTLHKLH